MTILNKLSFCSSDPCSSPESLPPHHEGKKPSFLPKFVLNMNMKTNCSWRKKKKKTKKKKDRRRHRHHHHHHQEPLIMADLISKDISLEEWFAKSPSVGNKRICKNHNDNGGGSKLKDESCSGVSFSGQYSSGVSLEELLNISEFSYSESRRELSSSLEKLLMMREKKDNEEEVEVGLYSFTKSRSIISRERKVSFRLPEASDIIILNSPQH